MNNFLLKTLDVYFEEILGLESKIWVAENLLTQRANEIIAEKRTHKSLFMAATSYEDMTLENKDKSWFMPNHYYDITIDNIENEIEDIISQQSCLSISQAYDAFETYLIDILTEVIYIKPEFMSILKIKNADINEKSSMRQAIKSQKGKNNKGLLSLIRKLSSHYRSNEYENNFKGKISDWYELYSNVRHVIVHNRQVIPKAFLDYLKLHNAEKKFQTEYSTKVIGGKQCIFLKVEQVRNIIFRLNSFAHFVFKGLSLECNLKIDVPEFISRFLH